MSVAVVLRRDLRRPLFSDRDGVRQQRLTGVDWQRAGEEAAASLADFRHQIGLTAPYGNAAHQLDPTWSEQPPSRVFAAKLKAERERRRLERAAERAQALAGRRKRKSGDPPPPKTPAEPDPPPQSGIDPDELPFYPSRSRLTEAQVPTGPGLPHGCEAANRGAASSGAADHDPNEP